MIPERNAADPVRLNLQALRWTFAQTLTPGLAHVDSSGEPRDHALSSKACTQRDVERSWFAYWCRELRIQPAYHRKLWEYAFLLQVLHERGMLRGGGSGLPRRASDSGQFPPTPEREPPAGPPDRADEGSTAKRR